MPYQHQFSAFSYTIYTAAESPRTPFIGFSSSLSQSVQNCRGQNISRLCHHGHGKLITTIIRTFHLHCVGRKFIGPALASSFSRLNKDRSNTIEKCEIPSSIFFNNYFISFWNPLQFVSGVNVSSLNIIHILFQSLLQYAN